MSSEPWRGISVIEHSQLLLDSFEYWTGQPLGSRDGDPGEQARILFAAPFVVASHGIEAEPILNYGNQLALDLWEMDWKTFITTPSRYTAEPIHQGERAKILARTSRQGYIDGYTGVRITKLGRRFCIKQATIWNVRDNQGHYRGQAATFSHWQFLRFGSSTRA
jgi:hypothetical protein